MRYANHTAVSSECGCKYKLGSRDFLFRLAVFSIPLMANSDAVFKVSVGNHDPYALFVLSFY